MKTKIILALSIIAVTSATFAQPKLEDQIKFRQSGMMFMRWNMGTIKNQVVKNPQTYNKKQVIAAANVIAAVANSGIETLFTAETKTGKGWKDTRVKPEFFEESDEVKKHVLALKKEANELVKAADNGEIETIKEQFESLFKACKACHKKYRAKD